MTGSLHYCLDQLKKELVLKSGIKNIGPSDCKFLSAQVLATTQKRISETTLKRIFGFAYSKFTPSLFTLNALSEYCGHFGWDEFCSSVHYQHTSEKESNSWTRIVSNAEQITDNTLHVLKSRSGIPYEKTIQRNFLDEHMEMFLAGDYTATLISAPADYGKTIALCHWVEQLLTQNVPRKSDDIILFFSSNVLYNPAVFGTNLNDWLLAFLGVYRDENLSALSEIRNGSGKMYLIIDGIDDGVTPTGHTVFNQIIDIISLFGDSSWLKIIITVRSFIWTNNKHYTEGKNQKWFTGFMSGENRDINMPLLNYDEIIRISDNLGWEKHTLLRPEMIVDAFCYPLCIQYHYQNYGEHFSLENVSEFTVYEAISTYFLHRIYRGRYSHEIMMLLMKLSGAMDIVNGSFTANRFKVHYIFKEHEKAYLELVGTGFVEEFNISDENNYISYFRISNRYALTRVLAEKLLFENDYIFNNALIVLLDSYLPYSVLRISVLKWCIYLTVSNKRPCRFSVIDGALNEVSDKFSMGVFLSHLVKKYPEVLHIEKSDSVFGEKYNNAGYLIGLEYINKDYGKILNTLLSLDLTPKYRIIARTCIGVMSIIQLDIRKLEEQIALMKAEQPVYYLEFAINPLNCLETIYYYLKFGIIKKEALSMLTRFYFDPVSQVNHSYPEGFEEILHLLGLYTLSIAHNEKKTLRFINALRKVYPDGSESYRFLFKILTAEIQLGLGNYNESLRLFEDVFNIYSAKESSLTDFMKVSYYALKIKLENLNSCPKTDQINTLMRYCDESEYKLLKVHSLAFLLNTKSQVSKDPGFIERYYFDLVKTTRGNGCRVESFVFNS